MALRKHLSRGRMTTPPNPGSAGPTDGPFPPVATGKASPVRRENKGHRGCDMRPAICPGLSSLAVPGERRRPREAGGQGAHPQERVQGAVLHELGEDHDGYAVGDHALQADDVGVLELAHDGGLTQELPPLALRVAPFQGLDGHTALFLPRGLEPPPAHLAKLAFGKDAEGQPSSARCLALLPPTPLHPHPGCPSFLSPAPITSSILT